MADLIQLRRDLAANWTTENPVLAQGEPGIELDTTYQKIGDGVTAWNSLTYVDKDSISGLQSVLDAKQATLVSGTNIKTINSTSLLGSGDIAIASGSPGLVLLATATASNVTSVDFTTGIDSTYDEYEVHLLNVLPITDSTYLWLRTSANGGSSYDSGSSDYGGIGTSFVTVWAGNFVATSAQIALHYEYMGNATNENGISGVIRLMRPSVVKYGEFLWTACMNTNNGWSNFVVGYGARKSAAAVNAIRFLFSTGNIASGEFKLYGLKKSL